MQSLVFNLVALAAAAMPALAETQPSILLGTISGGNSGSPNQPSATTITVSSGPPPVPTPQTGCPTITATGELCQTCMVPACLAISTVTQSCGCPSVIATATLDYPCKDNCAGVWCSTSYVTVSNLIGCPTSSGGPKTTGSATLPTAGIPTSASTSTRTSSIVTVNAAGRMAVPAFGGWFF